MRSPDSSLTILGVLTAFAAAVMFAATTVTVDDGDTLSAIAAEHGVSVAELVTWNEIDDPDRIFSGDLLVLAAPAGGGGAAASSGTTHVVTAGETLSLIAARYGATVALLADANGLDDPDRIRAGAVLVVEAAAPEQPAAPGPTAHVVLPGDTLWSIAAEYGVSIAELVDGNQLRDENHIVSGQTLLVGGGATDTTPPTATTTTVPTTTTTVAPAAETADDEAEPVTTTTEPDAAPSEPVIPRPSVTQTPLADAFARWSTSYGVPQDLLEAIAWHASDWQPAITGPDGRLGIGQLTPAAVELVEERLLGLDLDPLATSDGVRLAARYLRYLLDRTHSDREALIAWQVGLSAFLDGTTTPDAEAWADTVLEIRRMRA